MAHRILVVTGHWPGAAGSSDGIFAYQQTQALVEAGCAVTVLVTTGFGPHRTAREAAALPGARVIPVPYRCLPHRAPLLGVTLRHDRWTAGASLARTVKMLDGHAFDSVHVHAVIPAGLSFGHWSKALSFNSAVCTIHGADPMLHRIAGIPGLRASLKTFWRRMDHVVAVGRPLLPALERWGAPVERTRVIPNGAIIPEADDWSPAQRPLGEPRVILSVSNLIALKGIDRNLKALSRIKAQDPTLDWRYRIIGQGPEEAILRRMTRDLDLADRVSFLGRLPYEDTMREMAGCDIFSLPSWGDAFGIVYLEAMGRGRPVIGCTGSGAQETVRDGIDGLLVAPKDTQSLSEALSQLLWDPARCMAMGTQGRDRAQTFSWSANAAAYQALQAEAPPAAAA